MFRKGQIWRFYTISLPGTCLISVDPSVWVDFKILIGVCNILRFESLLAGNSKFASLHSEVTGGRNFVRHATESVISVNRFILRNRKNYWNNHNMGITLTLQGLGRGFHAHSRVLNLRTCCISMIPQTEQASIVMDMCVSVFTCLHFSSLTDKIDNLTGYW